MAKPPLEVVRIPALSDNYIWMIHDAQSGETVVVDPAEAGPVLAEAQARGWTITQIWNTHWHPDHTGGNASIKEATGCRITGPAAEAGRIPTLDVTVAEGDRVSIGDAKAEVWAVPGHTAGHIAFYLPEDAMIFIGDTLFAMGCGRLFEGTARQMFPNMVRLANLPEETRVFCAHEYTRANGRYALHVDPHNAALQDRMREVDRAWAAGHPTIPTTIALERATNPFLRAADVDEFARLRDGKDVFKG